MESFTIFNFFSHGWLYLIYNFPQQDYAKWLWQNDKMTMQNNQANSALSPGLLSCNPFSW